MATVANPSGEKHSIDNKVFLDAWNFKKTMNGEDAMVSCPFCKKGQIGGVATIFAKCDYCGGSGKIDNYLKLINLTDIPVYTTIIPKYP